MHNRAIPGSRAKHAWLVACVAFLASGGAASAQQSAVGDSQTTVHGYVQPTVQGNQNQPVQTIGEQPTKGEEGPPIESPTQSTPPGYVVPPTAVQESVKGRSRPEFDPIGIQLNDYVNGIGRLLVGRDKVLTDQANQSLSSFLIHWNMDVQGEYTSNLYRTQTNPKADYVLDLRPSFTVGSDWANDDVRFDAGADLGRHRRNGTEDFNDYYVGLSGRKDILEYESVSGGLRFDHTHQQRGSPDDPGDPVPTLFNTTDLNLGYRNDGGTIFNRTNLDAVYFDYLHNGGIDHSDLDRIETNLTSRFGFQEEESGTQFWIEPGANDRRYLRGNFNGNADRSSEGGQVLAGMTWDYTGITYFEFGVGYLRQDYDDPSFPTIQGPAFNGKMVWNATGLTTLTATVDRKIEETVQAGASGTLTTKYGLTADWEALYNLIVDTGVSFSTEDFRGVGRNDDVSGATFGTRYLFGRHWYAEARYSYNSRGSNASGDSYTDHRVLLTVGERL